MKDASRRGVSFELVRVTIETRSPLTIGTGGGDDLVDNICVSDANGLPTIPGSSLAGVLRSAVAGGSDPATDSTCKKLFGYQAGAKGASSLVEVSWGQVHASDDRPAPFRGADLTDPVLAFLAEGIVRDNVRIDPSGVVDGTGKFDVGLVPAGARFTFELVIHAGAPLDGAALVGMLASSAVRVGGLTRRGMGAFDVKQAAHRLVDLTRPSDRKALARLPAALHEPVPEGVLQALAFKATDPQGTVDARVVLFGGDTLLSGAGDPARDGHFRSDRAVDKIPYTEKRIHWSGGRGAVVEQPDFVLVATGIKGALWHRALFHAHRFAGLWSREEQQEAWDDRAPHRDELVQDAARLAVESLFGRAKIRRALTADAGDLPGRVFIDDIWMEDQAVSTVVFDHVALDRFTSAALDRRLFSEAPLRPPKQLTVNITVATRVPTDDRGRPQVDPHTDDLGRKALTAALEDLVEGRLALGAAASRGHGFFEGGMIDWSDGGAWIDGGAT